MDKRITIGLLFSYDENWIGGSYYIMNLIHSLNLLDDSRKPKLVILSKSNDDFEQIKAINDPYIQYESSEVKENSIVKWINKIARKFIFKRNIIKNINVEIDLLFPSSGNPLLSWIKNHLFWIPDFQELHLPEFYPNANLEKRKENRINFSKSKNNLVLSSYDALNDYNFFFPENNTKNYVLNFAVFHPEINDLTEKVLIKYDLQNKKYFFSPNQFWKHKNHMLVLKSLVLLKKENKLDFTVAFSGKESDFRNPDYFAALQDFVVQNNIQDQVKFLGFIDRREQLYLMKNALAVIQPSLFEGWSTVVEDAKKLNQNCIASNLNVHKEQLKNNGFYFDPKNEKELSDILLKFKNENIAKPDFKYLENNRNFGVNFINIVDEILGENKNAYTS